MFNSARILRALVALALLHAIYCYADEEKRAVKIVVPTAAEGSTDQLARILSAGMQERGYGKVEVVNMPGKSGAIAASYVANAKPDGSTLLIATPSSHSIAKAFSTSGNPLPYDPVTSFSIISCFAQAPYIFVVGPNGPQAFEQFIVGARNTASTLKYSSTGIGGPHHLIVEYLFGNLGVTSRHVPVAGGAKAIELVKTNEVQVMMPASILAIPQIQAGQIRALAVTGGQRLNALPTVPTFKELSIQLDLESWYGLMGPSGMEAKQVEQLAKDVQSVMQDPSTKKRIESLGIHLVDIRERDFAQMIEEETVIWQKVVKQVAVTN